MKSPNEAEYIEWEKRILKDIDEGYLKLSRLQTLKELIFSRCVILKDDGEVDYDLSLDLWHSKHAETADQNFSNGLVSQEDAIGVSSEKIKSDLNQELSEWIHVRFNGIIVKEATCEHGLKGKPLSHRKTGDLRVVCNHGTPEAE